MLEYIVKGQSNPKGKPKIYYTAHPKDHSFYFTEVTNDIFATQDCVIFYLKPGTMPNENYESELCEMQLFVIPVTVHLLHDKSRAFDDFKYAIEHNIPVLPLLMNEGIENAYNRICGQRHFLSKYAENRDGLNYNEKLERFLSSVPVGAKLAERIRAAFDAYIFINYRKKDRAYAKKLMHLIHQNDFCRNIAIWYDDFLTPEKNIIAVE